MVPRLAVLGLAIIGMLSAATVDETRQKLQVSDIQHFDFVSKGTVRFDRSFGELTVEKWDKPEVEVTTVKSTKDDYSETERGDGQRKLDRVRVRPEQRGDEIVISTDFRRRRILPAPMRSSVGGGVDLAYYLKVPAGTHLIVGNHNGEVHVDGITGDLDVKAHQGLIAISLPAGGKYQIDAKSKLGNVISDFPGHERRHLVLGHQFAGDSTGGTQKLQLRIGYGDITILKSETPQEPAPAHP